MRHAKFVVPGIPPSPNRYLGHHYQATRESRREWRVKGALARMRARQAGTWDGRPFGRCAVTVRPFFRDRRRRDPDNLAASLKQVLDMLRPMPGESLDGYPLVDDDFAHVPRLVVEYGGVDRRHPRVEVELAELDQVEESPGRGRTRGTDPAQPEV
jgi:hypothetical protein